MANLPLKVRIEFKDLAHLMMYYWAAVNSEEVGDSGTKTYEETAMELSNQSECFVTPTQLENLVYHVKQAVFEKIKPVKLDRKQRSYYHMMEKFQRDIPQLFKTLPSGEIVFINFEDKEPKHGS